MSSVIIRGEGQGSRPCNPAHDGRLDRRHAVLRIFVLSGASTWRHRRDCGVCARPRVHPQYRGDPAGHLERTVENRSVQPLGIYFFTASRHASTPARWSRSWLMALALSFLATLYPSSRPARLRSSRSPPLRVSPGIPAGAALRIRRVGAGSSSQAGTEFGYWTGSISSLRSEQRSWRWWLGRPEPASRHCCMSQGLLERPDGGAAADRQRGFRRPLGRTAHLCCDARRSASSTSSITCCLFCCLASSCCSSRPIQHHSPHSASIFALTFSDHI